MEDITRLKNVSLKKEVNDLHETLGNFIQWKEKLDLIESKAFLK